MQHQNLNKQFKDREIKSTGIERGLQSEEHPTKFERKKTIISFKVNKFQHCSLINFFLKYELISKGILQVYILFFMMIKEGAYQTKGYMEEYSKIS